MFLAALTTLELFAILAPWRMQVLSSGDGLEGHFQAVFQNFLTKLYDFFFMNWG